MSAESRAAMDPSVEVSALEMSVISKEEQEKVKSLLKGHSEDKGPATTKRSSMQDFSTFALWLPTEVWALYGKKDTDHVSLLKSWVDYLATNFGLRCPSEATQASMAALLLLREDEETHTRMLQNAGTFLDTVKAQISSLLAKHKVQKVKPEDYLLELPLEFSAMPEKYRSVAAAATSPAVPLLKILEMAYRMKPWRRSKKAKTEAKTPGIMMSAPNDPMAMIYGILNMAFGQHMPGHTSSSSAVPLQMLPPPRPNNLRALLNTAQETSEPPSSSRPTPETVRTDGRPGQLALMDQTQVEKPPADMKQPLVENKTVDMDKAPGPSVVADDPCSKSNAQEATVSESDKGPERTSEMQKSIDALKELRASGQPSPMKRPAFKMTDDSEVARKKKKPAVLKKPASKIEKASKEASEKKKATRKDHEEKTVCGPPKGNGKKMPPQNSNQNGHSLLSLPRSARVHTQSLGFERLDRLKALSDMSGFAPTQEQLFFLRVKERERRLRLDSRQPLQKPCEQVKKTMKVLMKKPAGLEKRAAMPMKISKKPAVKTSSSSTTTKTRNLNVKKKVAEKKPKQSPAVPVTPPRRTTRGPGMTP